MSSNKAKIGNMQSSADLDLGRTLLKIVAFGVAGGAALIGGAKALGDAIEEKQVKEYEEREAQREQEEEQK